MSYTINEKKNKELLYRDFYNHLITEEQLIYQISMIDYTTKKKNKLLLFLKEIIIPQCEHESCEL